MASRRALLVLAALVVGLGSLVLEPAGASGPKPIGLNDTYRMDAGGVLRAGRSVLKNDVDPEGDPLTVVQQGSAFYGSLDLRDDGRFTYTPPPGFHGTDLFSYTAFDGETHSNFTYVVIYVNGPADAQDDTYATSANQRLEVSAAGVLGNDADDSPWRHKLRIVDGPDHGRASIDRTGAFNYQPDRGYVGPDTFTYRLDDGGFRDTATVTIQVKEGNTKPVAVDDTYALGEDIWLEEAAPGLLANDTDADGDPLMAEIVSWPSAGYLTLEPDGSFIYEPYLDYDSDVTFTYRVFDGIEWSDPATVLIDMYAINDPPYAEDDYFATSQDTPLAVVAPGVLSNDYDPVESDALSASLVVDGPDGTATVNPDGSFTFIPNAGYFGWTYFTYQACDPGGCASATVTIEVFEASPE